MLPVNVTRMKMMNSSENAEKVTEESKFPCAVCRKGVAVISSSISFTGVRCIRDVVVLEVN